MNDWKQTTFFTFSKSSWWRVLSQLKHIFLPMLLDLSECGVYTQFCVRANVILAGPFNHPAVCFPTDAFAQAGVVLRKATSASGWLTPWRSLCLCYAAHAGLSFEGITSHFKDSAVLLLLLADCRVRESVHWLWLSSSRLHSKSRKSGNSDLTGCSLFFRLCFCLKR